MVDLIDIRATLPQGGAGSDPDLWATRERPPDLVCIHHSATPATTTVEAIARYHVTAPPDGKGRPSICYHYVVAADGRIFWCNDDDLFTWHGNAGNTGLGVCLIGNFMEAPPPPAQLEAAAGLVAMLRHRYPGVSVVGHREVGQTACPGDTWPQWRDQVAGAVMVDPPLPPPPSHVGDFSRFPRPPNDTGAGVHSGANGWFPLGEDQGGQVDEYAGQPVYGGWLQNCLGWRQRGFTWTIVVTIDDSALKCLPTILYSGIMPVLRTYRKYPGRVSQKAMNAVRMFVSWGGRYIQLGNEPNMVNEWDGHWPNQADWPAAFNQWAADWYADAVLVESWGGLPGLDPPSPGGEWRNNQLVAGDGDDPAFLEQMLRALKRMPGAVELLQRVGWLGVHPALLNHPLDYPDDAVNQAEHPGQILLTRYYADGMPTGASNCWRKWELYDAIVQAELSFRIPQIGTEGGAWSLNQSDPRYPALTARTASDRNVAIWRAMGQAPSWLLAQCSWLWANRWWSNLAPQFEVDAMLRVPGWGNCPTTEPPELPLVQELLANPIPPRGVDPVDVEKEIGDGLQAHVIPLNPDAAFEEWGKARGLLPASVEVDQTIDSVAYRSQAYRHPADRAWQWIVYCQVGNWENLFSFKRAN